MRYDHTLCVGVTDVGSTGSYTTKEHNSHQWLVYCISQTIYGICKTYFFLICCIYHKLNVDPKESYCLSNLHMDWYSLEITTFGLPDLTEDRSERVSLGLNLCSTIPVNRLVNESSSPLSPSETILQSLKRVLAFLCLPTTFVHTSKDIVQLNQQPDYCSDVINCLDNKPIIQFVRLTISADSSWGKLENQPLMRDTFLRSGRGTRNN